MTTLSTKSGTAFSAQIRGETLNAHEEARSAAVMQRLFKKTLSLEDYARLTAQYYFIYGALERNARVISGDPQARPFIDARLARRPSLENDLQALLGDAWQLRIEATPATAAYVRRLDEVSAWAGGFVAHHYVRYLGDLSGGQHIGEVVRCQFNLESGGASFYIFDEIEDAAAFKDTYRAALDAAPWDEAERSRVLDEILHAYELNTAVLHSLA
jgi:heme oxygenase